MGSRPHSEHRWAGHLPVTASGGTGTLPSLMPALPPLLLILAALPLLALAQGCGKASPYPLGRNATSSIVTTPDGLNRTYNIYVPSGYNSNQATPLMLFFHGGGGTGALYESRYGMDIQAENLKFITVYPDGYQNTWNGGTCCGAARNANIDDVNFVSQLIDLLSSQLCIDVGRYAEHETCIVCRCIAHPHPFSVPISAH